MKVVASPSELHLDNAHVKNLYPQLFTKLAELDCAPATDFELLFPQFTAELARDFLMEEQFMEGLGFHELKMHRAQHAELLRLLHHAQARLLIGDHHLSRKILPLLSQWLIHHISSMDAAWIMIAHAANSQQQAMLRNAA